MLDTQVFDLSSGSIFLVLTVIVSAPQGTLEHGDIRRDIKTRKSEENSGKMCENNIIIKDLFKNGGKYN